ncbi:MAG: hypothetical protein JWQ76_2532, partial [Ramlibacter sp.]|nr:hypothetical protein [Ramlibacter sp.]
RFELWLRIEDLPGRAPYQYWPVQGVSLVRQ